MLLEDGKKLVGQKYEAALLKKSGAPSQSIQDKGMGVEVARPIIGLEMFANRENPAGFAVARAIVGHHRVEAAVDRKMGLIQTRENRPAIRRSLSGLYHKT